ncbi:hypothetical protein HI914_05365 [Erysiphe necator]|nr:hypothetical protein HI914_05365 [Erysiphe necator]
MHLRPRQTNGIEMSRKNGESQSRSNVLLMQAPNLSVHNETRVQIQWVGYLTDMEKRGDIHSEQKSEIMIILRNSILYFHPTLAFSALQRLYISDE